MCSATSSRSAFSNMLARAIASDYASARRFDADGRLHVASANISKACVSDYLGKEIPGWRGLELEANRLYPLLRDPDELAKAAPSFNGLPLLSRHVATSADDHPREVTVGATGNSAEFDAPFLTNSLVVWDGEAIAAIEDGTQRELSCGYRYDLDATPGTYRGRAFFGRMTNIIGNHVAIVIEGRVGADCVVGDAALNIARGLVRAYQLGVKKNETQSRSRCAR